MTKTRASASKTIPILSAHLLEAQAQCPRRAWLEVNEPQSRAAAVDAQYWQLQAEAVNRAARRQFAGAFSIYGDIEEAAEQTQELLSRHDRPTLFTPSFVCAGLHAQPDVLEVRPSGSIASELTASTCSEGELDPAKLNRVALRAGISLHVLARKKHKVTRALAHALDRDTAWDGKDPTYEGLLRRIDITEQAKTAKKSMTTAIAQLKKLVTGPEPEVAMTRHCRKPFDCPFTERCQSLPKRPAATVYDIPGRFWKTQDAWHEAGWYALKDVPADEVKAAGPMVERIVNATLTGRAWKSKEAAKLLDALPYPRYWFDFEAIALALPAWAQRRPYEQVPFQWSVHVERKNSKFTHKAFLDLSGNDPARSCAQALVKTLGKKGPVIVYHASYEASRLKEMAERYPDLADALHAIVARLVDLEKWIHAHYYHPSMKGSYSIKKVLPALAPDFTYDTLPGVHTGVDAQMAYLTAVNAGLNRDLFDKVRKGLLAYCAHDTWAMVVVAYRLTGKKPPVMCTSTTKPLGVNRFEDARIKQPRARQTWQLYEREKPLLPAAVQWVALSSPAKAAPAGAKPSRRSANKAAPAGAGRKAPSTAAKQGSATKTKTPAATPRKAKPAAAATKSTRGTR